MFTILNKKLVYLILFLIVATSFFLRVYKLDENPPSLSWDEVAVGYNAYSIANFGIDEWGKFMPVVFKSFGEYKNPIHIYIGAVVNKIIGFSDLSTRLPASLFGVFNVLLVFLYVKRVFKSDLLALLSAFFLAVSPYNIQFSRFNHELNFALFFFLIGLILFHKALQNKNFYIFSVASFSIAMITYSAAKVFIPLFLIILFLANLKRITPGKKLLPSFIFLVLFSIFIILNPNLLGLERLKQTTQGTEEIKATEIFKITNNVFFGRSQLIINNYFKYFNYKYLFVTGDSNPRHSIQLVGEFYKIEVLFLILGLASILIKIVKTKDSDYLILLVWVLLAPIPGAIGAEAPHAARAMFTNGSWHILSAFGLYSIFSLTKNKIFKLIVFIIFLVIFSFEFKNYLKNLFFVYPSKFAIEWQYGMKEIGLFVKANNDLYHTVYITNTRQQPYIFMLYNLKYSPQKYVKSVIYNKSKNNSSNIVQSFGKYIFDWDVVESQPVSGVLYVLTPYEYSGLRFKDSFDVKKVIKYPNGGDAFYLISAKFDEYE